MNISKHLKPQQLRLIDKIAATGKLQLAAEALNISQPAASRTLANIEAIVGVDLFERSSKGMVPTQIGTAFLRHSQTILTAFNNLETEVLGLGQGQMGRVRIGAVTGPAVRCLVPSVLEIKEQSPLIETTLEVAPSAELIRLLESGYYDFVIARMPSHFDSRAFHLLPARSETVSLVVRSGHPLVDKKNITLKELAEFDWTIQQRGSPIRDALEAAFSEESLAAPAQITNTSSLLVTLGLLEKSDTIATLIEEVVQLLMSGAAQSQLRVLHLKKQIRVAPYYIITKRHQNLSHVAERLLEKVVKRF